MLGDLQSALQVRERDGTLLRRADGGVLRGAHLECGGDDEAEIEGEIEELHVPRLEPPRVEPHRVGAHLDEEREVTLDDVVELSIVS